MEPSYGDFLSDFKCGTSQHPLDDVTRGESLSDGVWRRQVVVESAVLIPGDYHQALAPYGRGST
ncbi:MAG: hypothetical protein JO334_10650 [Verrucomicrobia bacterium]|nr:hypothetical protein [Verrucomicrobiota bacterium]